MPTNMAPTSEPESLPVPRGAVHVITLTFVAASFWIGGVIASQLPGKFRSSTPTFLWMPHWGNALGDAAVNALLTYTTVTLVLYGISIGGQAAFIDNEHRRRIRRSVGAIGILIAAAALTLGALAVAAAVTDSQRIPVLVVVLPLVGLCWVLGLEVGRFVVPAHHVQLDAARQTAEIAERRLAALPRPSRNVWTAHLATIGHGLLAGIATGCVVQAFAGRGFYGGLLVGTVSTTAGLLMLLQINAGTLEAPGRAGRLWTRGLTFTGYALLVLFASGVLLLAAPAATAGLIPLFICQLALPLLFRRPLVSVPSWVVELSLSGAIARVAADDLQRGLRTTRRRIRDLETLEQGHRDPSLRSRIVAALHALR